MSFHFSQSVVVGALLVLTLGEPAIFAEQPAKQPATLEAFSERLGEQQQSIDRQQEQIEMLAEYAEKTAEAPEQKLHWQGYGVINYQRYDFFENIQDNDPETRVRTDVERIILVPSYDFGDGYSFVAEIEFEHGGTGSTIEFEKEEAGEFEVEVEKGGEIVLEQAHLLIERSPAFNWRIGEIMVPFSMVNSHHQPSQYFTLERSLAETDLIPAVWHETGIELFGEVGQLKYQAQLITGLDSSGFSGPFFVRNGRQGKLEFDNADNLGLVGRLDYTFAPGVLLGGSVYVGDTADNRPRKNLDTSANVALFELHGRYETGPLTLRSEYLQGTIENSDKVSEANRTTFNGGVLGVSSLPVGHQAEAWFLEGGYDVFSLFSNSPGGRLDLFARAEAWNSQAKVEGDISKQSRYDREAISVGANYKPRPGIVFKTEFSRRKHAGSIGNQEDVIGLGLGFEF
jgi:hypothetical protein